MVVYCPIRAREIATRMTKPAESVAAAADLLEDLAHLRRVGGSAKAAVGMIGAGQLCKIPGPSSERIGVAA